MYIGVTLEDAIGIFENILINSSSKTLLEILVKYDKKRCRSFLVPKCTKKGLFGGLKRVRHTLNAWFEAGWRTLLVYLKI